MADNIERSGRCLCGEVRFTAVTTGNHVDACHCGMCRRWGGGPYLSVHCAGAPRFATEDNIAVYDSSAWAQRGFCKRCGSHLFYRLKGRDHYEVPAALFDGSPEWTLHQQIFIDEKPAFYAFANDTRTLTGAEAFALFGAAPE